MDDSKNPERMFGIKFISVINGFAAFLHLIFWILAFLHLSNSTSESSFAERANLGTTYGFGIADILWSITFLTIGSIGLWKLNPFGWLAAQFANVLYWYSLTVVLTKDLFTRSVSPGTILFLPFALFSVWAVFYLWKVRDNFFNQ
jgi:hypothetical protein